MSNTYDVIVIGAGYHGCSCSYFLSKAGLKVLLVEKNDIGSGASGANFGTVQVQDCSMGLSFDMTVAGYERMKTMEQELGRSISYNPRGSLLVAENENQLPVLEEVYNVKKAAGLGVKWLGPKEIQEVEPNIKPGSVLAASYNDEGFVYPFHYLYALVGKAVEYGLDIRRKTEVKSLLIENGCCKGIILEDDSEIRAENVVVAAASGTRAICATANLDVPVLSTKAESFVTEAIQPFLRNYYSSAGFFVDSHSQDSASVSLCISQSHYGNLLIAETTKPFENVDSSGHDCTSVEHCKRIKEELLRVFPVLENIQILRSWVTASPFTATYEPFFGKSPVEGLFLAAGFKSSVVVSGFVGETIRDLIVSGTSRFDLSPFTDRIRYLN